MKILYYDCFSGISGDMHLGAMIDAGVNPDHLLNELKKLPLTGYQIHISRDKRQGIEGTRVDVIIDEKHEKSGRGNNTDGQIEELSRNRLSNHKKPEKSRRQELPGKHHHAHHNLQDIENIILQSELADKTKERALNMFRMIAKAEAKIHGISIEKVHFHEVGATDSIIDITGAAICLEYLKPDRILSSAVELGGGTVQCSHGIMPVPAPATAEILKGIPVKLGNVHHEATTPTGAAILAANVDEFTDKIQFHPLATAYGIGQRDTEVANVLRIFTAEMAEDGMMTGESTSDDHIMIECNLDDMNPEFYSPLMDTLFSQGSDDVYFTPITMKKSRPAVKITVLCHKNYQQKLSELLLTHTTTLGVRSYPVSKTMLKRETETVTTSLGQVTIKKAWYKGELLKWKLEYDDCKLLADRHGLSVRKVYQTVESELSLHPFSNKIRNDS
ncbi:MAG: nickel pincer cofactor biosynthesis protein LarC [Balneolales bacterium]